MDYKGYRIDRIKRSIIGMKMTYPSRVFIKVTHVESNISVTRYGKNGIEAREMALKDLSELLNLWKNS